MNEEERELERQHELDKIRLEKSNEPVPVSNIIAGVFSFLGFMIFVVTLLYFGQINGCLKPH